MFTSWQVATYYDVGCGETNGDAGYSGSFTGDWDTDDLGLACQSVPLSSSAWVVESAKTPNQVNFSVKFYSDENCENLVSSTTVTRGGAGVCYEHGSSSDLPADSQFQSFQVTGYSTVTAPENGGVLY
jgi:hypothetical protein